MILGLSGKASSGKDTVASMLQHFQYTRNTEDYDNFDCWNNPAWRHLVNKDCSLEIKKFAYKVKLVASILTGIPVSKFEDQKFKQSILGMEWSSPTRTGLEEPFPGVRFMQQMSVRELLQKTGTDAIRNGLHQDAWVNALWADYQDGNKWIITDVRFPNEYDSIKEHGGIMIRLTRNDSSEDTHISETALDNYKFDYVVDNEGLSLQETYNKVKSVYEQIIQETNSKGQRNKKLQQDIQEKNKESPEE